MNTKIQIKDRFFTPYISRDEIAAAVGRIASKMNQDLAGKNPLFLCVERRICFCSRSFS